MHTRRRHQILFLLAAASVLRAFAEVRAIAAMCCYDFPLFWNQVQSFASGGTLYSPDLSSYGPGEGTYKYPPLLACFILPATRFLTLDQALLGYMFLQLGFYAVVLWVMARAMAPPQQERTFGLLLVILAFNHGPFYETLLRLQFEVPILLALGLALLCLARRRDMAAGFWIGVATMLKVYPAMMLLVGAARRGSVRLLVGFGLACGAILIAGIGVFGLEENRRFFFEILPLMLGETPTELYGSENASVARYLMTLMGLAPHRARLVASLVSLVLLAVSTRLLVLRRGRAGTAAGWETGLELGILVAVTLLAMPNAWTNYQLLLLIPLAAILANLVETGRWQMAHVLAGGASVLMTYHKDVYYWQPGLIERWPVFTETIHGARPLASILIWIASYSLLRCARGPHTNASSE